MLPKSNRSLFRAWGDMEIHKPKLARNWREFAIEIGTIICGILIALGLEQTVEWLHRRSEMAEARLALKSEIAANAHAAKFNLEYDRCLLALGGRFAAWATGGPRPPTVPGGTPWITPGAVNWDVVKAGAVAHMPLRERLAYANIYNDVAQVASNIGLQGDIWVRLASQGFKVTLAPAEAQRTFEDAHQAQFVDGASAGFNRKLLHDATAAGVEHPALSVEERAFLTKFCKPVGVSPRLD